ncbi:MAG: transcription termination/antitermination protein NusG [Elusimicrobia bacterium]|jgi:transcriptional antiterminator NusG|nr:transcription termination/antitermination protein NusG [Elusimicrobiota bacterium]
MISKKRRNRKKRVDWYVVNTYTGQEDKIKARIEKLIEKKELGDKIFKILIPKKEVMTLRKGKKKVVEKEFFPGYILVNMVKDADSYTMIKNITGVTDFLGGKNYMPLTSEEFAKIQNTVKQKESEDPRPAVTFKSGDNVRIIDGPFDNFMGIVEETDEGKQKVKVMVTIFGRTTPVELDFLQVEKS